jgi:fructokinase
MVKSEVFPIVVFGEALIDDFGNEQVIGGAPFNVARNLAAFGCFPMMITRVGSDAQGAQICGEFDRFGLSRNGLQMDDSFPTGRVVVQVRQPGKGSEHSFVILPEQAYDYLDKDVATKVAVSASPRSIYFGTLAQRNSVSRKALHNILSESDAKCFLDLNIRPAQVTEEIVSYSLHAADIVKVNESEFSLLCSWYLSNSPGTDDMESPAIHDAIQDLMRLFQLKSMIVTLGERGCAYFEGEKKMVSIYQAASPENVVDTVGAGDAFSSIFLLGNLLEWPIGLTLARANLFAASICTIAGAVPVDLRFYQHWITQWNIPLHSVQN